MKAEEMLWLGDGFNSGADQVGRFITKDGHKGVVISGTELTMRICWDSWLQKLLKLFFKAPCPWCGRYHD